MATITIKGTNTAIELVPGKFYSVSYYQETTNRESLVTTPEILMFLCENTGFLTATPTTKYRGFRFANWVASGDSSLDTFWRVILADDIVDIEAVDTPPTSAICGMASTFKTGVNEGDLTSAGDHLITFDLI